MYRMVWKVSYKLEPKGAQAEIKKYTKEAAYATATGISDVGGLAVVTEDVELVTEEINDDLVTVPVESANKLHWD